jgi:hypothetical protein
MTYVEAPNTFNGSGPSIFLAGGITQCPDWQAQLIEQIKGLNMAIFNPRRKNFPIKDPTAAEAQITWEFKALRQASMISFWFCKETMNPIVLFELGSWVVSQKSIVVGMDKEYSRRQDVEIQTKLSRPDIQIVYNLKDLADGVTDLYNKNLLKVEW